MQVIIPVAGRSTRLYPHTHTLPKPLLPVAGKLMIEHIFDELAGVEVSEFLFITGLQGELFAEHMRRNHPDARTFFVEQKARDGPGGAIGLVLDRIREPVLIIYADTLFSVDIGITCACPYDGIIWAQEVEEYERFGVMVTDAQRMLTRIIEKPKEPISRLANIGMYYLQNTPLFVSCMREILARPPANGKEYYLIDAFQLMVDRGAKLLVEDARGWYDCGTHEALLATNAQLLAKKAGPAPRIPGVKIIAPVSIAQGVSIQDATIGPNVSIAAGATITSSTISEAILAEEASVSHCSLTRSVLGRRAIVQGVKGRVLVGDEAKVLG